jgi:transposase
MEVVRRPLNVEQRVAITLWRLGTNLEYRSISHLFGVGLSTVCVVVHEVCTAQEMVL